MRYEHRQVPDHGLRAHLPLRPRRTAGRANRGAREVLGGGVGVVVDESQLGPELAHLLTDGAYRRSYEQAGLAQRSTYDIGVIADTYCRLISAQLARTTNN